MRASAAEKLAPPAHDSPLSATGAEPSAPRRGGLRLVGRSHRAARGPRILMTTEGTYPYAVGGVSSWCDLLIGGLTDFRWQILPIVAGGRLSKAVFDLPGHATLCGQIELWSEQPAPRRFPAGRDAATRHGLAATLVRGLISWDGDIGMLTDALVWCRRRPQAVRPAFRSSRCWSSFLVALQEILQESHSGAAPPPQLDTVQAARLYQTLYWIARTAAVPTPQTDLLHPTAAGWAVVPALVHKALFGTSLLLTEHGVYVREAYLAAARSPAAPGDRFLSSRLARGLSRAAYAAADFVSPVTEANANWERGLGVDADKIRVIQNGIEAPISYTPAPRNFKVVSVGRIDPLKDVQTMLRVAVEVARRVPEVRFEYWGPPTKGQEAYARACEELARKLGVGEHFKFMGRTSDPLGVVREADVVLMTSISEGLPMSILEAMAQGRPVVATGVGGVPEVLHGCGIVAPPGDVQAIATGVQTLLQSPQVAAHLGQRGFARVGSRYTKSMTLNGYRDLLTTMVGRA